MCMNNEKLIVCGDIIEEIYKQQDSINSNFFEELVSMLKKFNKFLIN